MNLYHRTALAALAVVPALVLSACTRSYTPESASDTAIQCVRDIAATLSSCKTENAAESAEKLEHIHTILRSITHSVSQMTAAQKEELKEHNKRYHAEAAGLLAQCTVSVVKLERDKYHDNENLKQVVVDINNTISEMARLLK